ncbi:MAG: dihydroorotate dehydrogenase electron transfer subunit, partial [Pseudomonadota bacterium]
MALPLQQQQSGPVSPHPLILEATCIVRSNDAVNEDYRLLILDAPRAILDCQPGQFFHLKCPERGAHQPYLRRPMSIYGFYPDKEELHFLYKIAGEGTAAMAGLRKGDAFNVLGPLGHGFEIRP